jgi:hypothetical protein
MPDPAPRRPLVPSLSLAIRLAIWLRKGVILVLGLSVVALGIVMLVTPGPAFVVIPAGLAILATEFFWARRLLLKVRQRIEERVRQTLGGPNSAPTTAADSIEPTEVETRCEPPAVQASPFSLPRPARLNPPTTNGEPSRSETAPR